MGNSVSSATKESDGYYYWQACNGSECPTPTKHYKIYLKNAEVIPFVSNPTEKYILVDSATMEESIIQDQANFMKTMSFLDTADAIANQDFKKYQTPKNACLRVDPCKGIVQDRKLCCSSPTDTKDNKTDLSSVLKIIRITSLILISICTALLIGFMVITSWPAKPAAEASIVSNTSWSTPPTYTYPNRTFI